MRLSQGCVIVLGKTNMFRYNDPLEAANLRKSMTDKTRKTSLMNQSLMSQSLSDLRNPSQQHSAEFRMFASDSDIKDIAEGSEEGPGSLVLTASPGSKESVATLKNPGSGASTLHSTPRRPSEDRNLEVEGRARAMTDINANPRLSHSTPGGPGEGRGTRELDSVSPVAFVGEGGAASSSMATSSSEGSVELSQLYQDICDQKDVIMSCLEEDNCDIDQVSSRLPSKSHHDNPQLNAEIAKLQGMQHKYSLLEFESTKSLWLHQSGDEAGFYQEKFAQLIEAEVDRRLEAEGELRLERERQERELLLLEKEQELERLRVQHEREMYLMKKKLSTVSLPSASTTVPAPRLILSIPRYLSVGSGKTAYVEYEVRVEVAGAAWSLFRRYRQFRDLHSSLATRYGAPVQSLAFPGRKLFGSRTEAVSLERQRELQHYLSSLVAVAAKVTSCPLHREQTR